MRLAVSLILFAGAAFAQSSGWKLALEAVGLKFNERLVFGGAIPEGGGMILEGQSALAATLGFVATAETVKVVSVVDVHDPKLSIVWEKSSLVERFRVPADAKVFVTERWSKAPLLAGVRRGNAFILWSAVDPGPKGYDRFPYLLHAMADLGQVFPFRSNRLWAFFDYSYRMRSDPEYLAPRWRNGGIAALHVAAWHFYDADAIRDDYLKRLLAACRRNGILVYAWLELPHVSERFWNEHPEWREKTALAQDAQLDWRRLMNLLNPDCARAVEKGVDLLLDRFDWDGVNLAEMYFESLEGVGNPARFTPMNADVQALYRKQTGRSALADIGTPRFLRFRSGLVQQLQNKWLQRLDLARQRKPDLDVVLTQVDDRLDTGMKDAIGVDSDLVLPLLKPESFTFLVEDPATVWNLGPERYTTIAARYAGATRFPEGLAVDINIVERYQDVYPTRQQTGVELLRLVHCASASFPRVALYGENSIEKLDLELLPHSGAVVKKAAWDGKRLTVDVDRTTGVAWTGEALVDGIAWPFNDGATVWIPAGRHTLQPSGTAPAFRIADFNGELRSVKPVGPGFEIRYQSTARVLLRRGGKVQALPRGIQTVTIRGE